MHKEIVPPFPRAESRLLRHEWQTAHKSNLPEVTTVRSQAQYHSKRQSAKQMCCSAARTPLVMGGLPHKYVEHASRPSEICFWLCLVAVHWMLPRFLARSLGRGIRVVDFRSDLRRESALGAYFASTIVPPALQNLTPNAVCGELNLDGFAHPLFPGLLEPNELSPRLFLSSLPRFVDVFHSLFLF